VAETPQPSCWPTPQPYVCVAPTREQDAWLLGEELIYGTASVQTCSKLSVSVANMPGLVRSCVDLGRVRT
jgi:hypothetical protein